MSLRENLAAICANLPGAEKSDPWGGGHDAWKVCDKMFTCIGAKTPGVAVKCADIETAEKIMKESNLDEDKLLEGENLDNIEKKFNVEQQESLDELEENFGKRYLDEDLNYKENPYGLTEFDIEEIDELLNVDKETE